MTCQVSKVLKLCILFEVVHNLKLLLFVNTEEGIIAVKRKSLILSIVK